MRHLSTRCASWASCAGEEALGRHTLTQPAHEADEASADGLWIGRGLVVDIWVWASGQLAHAGVRSTNLLGSQLLSTTLLVALCMPRPWHRVGARKDQASLLASSCCMHLLAECSLSCCAI